MIGRLILSLALLATITSAVAEIPLPRAKPDRTPDSADIDRSREPRDVEDEAGAEEDAENVMPPVDEAALAACLGALRSRGVQVTRIDPIDEPPCRIPAPLEVTAYGSTSLSTPAILVCPMARAVADWLDDIVRPEARRIGAELSGLTVAASYVCRSRNRQDGAKLSEHGHANALDVSSFLFTDRRPIAVQPYDTLRSRETLFLDRVRTGACHYATTVLGPGSDGFHTDHIHLDLGRHGRSGTYRICQ